MLFLFKAIHISPFAFSICQVLSAQQMTCRLQDLLAAARFLTALTCLFFTALVIVTITITSRVFRGIFHVFSPIFQAVVLLQ